MFHQPNQPKLYFFPNFLNFLKCRSGWDKYLHLKVEWNKPEAGGLRAVRPVVVPEEDLQRVSRLPAHTLVCSVFSFAEPHSGATHPWQQWAAVSTYWSDRRAPPQLGDSEPLLPSPAIHGYSFTSVCCPLMIRVFLCTFPQSVMNTMGRGCGHCTDRILPRCPAAGWGGRWSGAQWRLL